MILFAVFLSLLTMERVEFLSGFLSADYINKDNVGCHGILLLLPKLLLLELYKFRV